jgi:hypothetical protein
MPINGKEIAIGAAISVPMGIVTAILWTWLKKLWDRRQNQIKIDSPRSGESLHDSRHLTPGLCYKVTGRLAFLSKDNQIWLLVQDPKTRNVWPQGFQDVVFREDTGTWEGYIYSAQPNHSITIVAVVAPRSSQMLFNYYQRHGKATQWAPIADIPDECANRKHVQAKIP